MRFWRGRPKDATHIGIELRITLPGAGPLVEASSDHLHLVARYSAISDPCQLSCLPGCRKHGWLDLLGGPDMKILRDPDQLLVEIRPAWLPNDYPGV